MSQDITLEKSLQSYRAIAAPRSGSWRLHMACDKYESPEYLRCSDIFKKEADKNFAGTNITISQQGGAGVVRAGDLVAPVINSPDPSKRIYTSTLADLVHLVYDPNNNFGTGKAAKSKRRLVYSTANGRRPRTGNDAYLDWNGFQVIDMDIKDQKIAQELKARIFHALYKCSWFLGVTLSASGSGLHIYTKIMIPDDMVDLKHRKMLFLTNFRHKYSFVYLACLKASEVMGFTKEDIFKWMDLSMARPAQGAFIPYDAQAMFNTWFLEDYIYICFDNVEDIGAPEVDWMTHPDLKQIFASWETMDRIDEENQIEINVTDKTVPGTIKNKVHYKHGERWRMANTLVALYGYQEGYKILRQITSNDVSDRELMQDCKTAERHEKKPELWAISRLNSVHGFKIKTDIEGLDIDEQDMMVSMSRISNPNIIRPSNDYIRFDINKNQYLGHILQTKMIKNPDGTFSEHKGIMDCLGRLTLIEAGPGLGKTEMVKQLVSLGKKIMMVMPFTSTIKSKVEEQEGWYYSYGSRKPKLDVEHGLALTVDKFSRLNMQDIAVAGFDYIFIDESHLLFMSEYRNVMSNVINMIRHAEVPVIMMSGTPTGELIFFPDIVHIHVVKEEIRQKELQVNIVDNQSNLFYHMCKAMADEIAAGKRILFPSNEGTLYSKKVKAGIEYYLKLNHQWFDRELNFAYYKKSQLGEAFMDDVNFKKTIKDLNVLMCTSYLSVGVDILDKYEFSIYFADLCTAAECDQWANRIRNRDLFIKLYIAKNDAEGQPRYISRVRPMNLKLDDEEIKDMHSIIRICNESLERNPIESKYNPIIGQILHGNQYVKYDPQAVKYSLDEMAYRVVMFERKYRDYMQQLLVFMKGMEQYGYRVSIINRGDFKVEGSEVFRDLKNMVKLANDEQLQLNTIHVEELLELITADRLEKYKDALSGRYELRVGDDWVEDDNNNIMQVKSIEVFEKVVPIFLSMSKRFDIPEINEIFYACKRPQSGTYNWAALARFRALTNILTAQKNKKLDKPIEDFVDAAYIFAAKEKSTKDELTKFIHKFAEDYARKASDVAILINRSELSMKRLCNTFTNIFKCLIHTSRPDKQGNIEMVPIEFNWQTREEKFSNPNKNMTISDGMSDFIKNFMGSDPTIETITFSKNIDQEPDELIKSADDEWSDIFTEDNSELPF